MKIRLIYLLAFLNLLSCKQHTTAVAVNEDSLAHCASKLPSRLGNIQTNDSTIIASSTVSHKGMVWIEGGDFIMGSQDQEGRADENPSHKVKLKGFWMDATEVTNAAFKEFVDATGYVTTAEKAPDWNELKKGYRDGKLMFTPIKENIYEDRGIKRPFFLKSDYIYKVKYEDRHSNWKFKKGETTKVKVKRGKEVLELPVTF